MNPQLEQLMDQAQRLTDSACAIGVDTLVIFRTPCRGIYEIEHHAKDGCRKIAPEFKQVACMHPRVLGAAIWVHRMICRICRKSPV